jgi:hypothetical protein
MASPPEAETPYIYHPDMKDDDSRNGLMCFLDQTRECGAGCMAYLTTPPEGTDYLGQWSNCMLLVSAHRGAKHLTILAQVTDGFLQKQRAQAADQARHAQTPPPVPR